MKAVLLEGINQYGHRDCEMPQPRHGEVLIRVAAAPINPADIVSLKGQYGTKKELPFIPGLEGSGTVVESGGGLLAWSLRGARVAFVCPKGNGSWCQFAIAAASNCVALPTHIQFEQGACFFANPWTAVMLMECVRTGKHRAIVQTAAASAVGKMMLKYCNSEGVVIVNIVRRQGQVESLKGIGAAYVLDSSQEGFLQELEGLCRTLGVTCAFDSVSGTMTAHLVNSLIEGSVVYVFGALGREEISGISPAALLSRNITVKGLWLSLWLKSRSLFYLWRTSKLVLRLLPDILKTEIAREFALEDFTEALTFYKNNMSLGKVLLKPNK